MPGRLEQLAARFVAIIPGVGERGLQSQGAIRVRCIPARANHRLSRTDRIQRLTVLAILAAGQVKGPVETEFADRTLQIYVSASLDAFDNSLAQVL